MKKGDIVNHMTQGPADDAIVELLSDLARRVRGELRRAAEVDGRQSTPFQNEILAYVGRCAGISVTGLSALSGRDKAQVIRIIAELEALDLVARERSATDRRSTLLSLTDRGQEVFNQVLRRRKALATAMLKPLSRKDRVDLARMLESMRAGF